MLIDLECAEVHQPLEAEHLEDPQNGSDVDDVSRDAVSKIMDDSADFESQPYKGGHRHLLQKRKTGKGKKTILKRFQNKYSPCPRCTIARCSVFQHGRCQGSCRKMQKIFKCSTDRKDTKTCTRPHPRDDPEKLAIDPLGPLSSVVVSTRAPFIPCAEIEGQPTGCPDRLTPFARGRGFRRDNIVQFSTCVTHKYLPHECESPFYPFGYCTCSYSYSFGRGGGLQTTPCLWDEFDSDDLPLVTRRRPSGGASRIEVNFGERRFVADDVPPKYTYNHKFPTRTAFSKPFKTADVTLEYFRGFSLLADRFTFNGTKDTDYDISAPLNAHDVAVWETYYEDQGKEPRTDCDAQCFFEGADVLGSIGEDEYSVQYSTGMPCSPCTAEDVEYDVYLGAVPDGFHTQDVYVPISDRLNRNEDA